MEVEVKSDLHEAIWQGSEIEEETLLLYLCEMKEKKAKK
jgi:hypothetical protein